jgi:hypothetical protein
VGAASEAAASCLEAAESLKIMRRLLLRHIEDIVHHIGRR